jgi:ABC-type Fe3+-hydroxamate transport system substrate-binding protein
MKNELTPEEKAIAQLFSVICAIVQSDHTPRVTIEATMQTLGQIFNNEEGPFNATDELQQMTAAMIDNINAIVDRKNKPVRAQQGADILNNINWN